ncbi:MAG TPA: sigma factor, partial [Urbifossiella sp.]|nr:sigma factor [Urbifossiella sp.]
RLSEIQTAWSLLDEARQSTDRPQQPTENVRKARDELVATYQRAVFSYLCGCVRDPEVARDLAQEFWLHFLRGGFDNADPERGSFRKYLKSALSHMAARVKARGRPHEGSLPPDVPAPEANEWAEFDEGCRRGFLNDAWNRLATDAAVRRGQYAALRLKADHPELPNEELARMMQNWGTGELSNDGFRKALQRAREHFAEFVYSAVANSLNTASPQEVARELGELGLLRYCRSFVEKRIDPASPR